MYAVPHHAHQSELLAEHLRTFLPGIEPEALELLCSHLEWVEVPGGGTLINQGEPGESMYITVSGRLRAYVRDADGQQRRVADMGRGQIIGEISLFTGAPRAATVVAVRDSVLVRLTKDMFKHLLARSAQVSIALTRQIHASGTAEREAALAMLGRRGSKNKRATVGADKGYDSKAFVKGCRKLKVTPHVAAKDKHSAVDARVTRHEGYKVSLKVRKRIEEAFGWIKTVGGLAKTKLIGQAKLAGQALLCFATYNLVRMGSLGGWWDAHHA